MQGLTGSSGWRLRSSRNKINSFLPLLRCDGRHVRSYSRFNVFIVLKDTYDGYRKRIELTSLLYTRLDVVLGWDGLPVEQFNVRNGCSLVFT